MNREFERFIHSNVAAGRSFALETTLRSTITFEQAKLAKEKGFRVFMRYVALDTVERNNAPQNSREQSCESADGVEPRRERHRDRPNLR